MINKLVESDHLPMSLLFNLNLVEVPKGVPQVDLNDIPASLAALDTCMSNHVDKVEIVMRDLKEDMYNSDIWLGCLGWEIKKKT